MSKVYGAGEGYPRDTAVAGGKAGPAVSSSDNLCLVEWTTRHSVVFVSVTRPLGMTRRPPRTSTCRWLPGSPACKQLASKRLQMPAGSCTIPLELNPLPYDLNACRNHRQRQSDVELFYSLTVRSKLCKVELMTHCNMFDK
jgi:hypothetical protein